MNTDSPSDTTASKLARLWRWNIGLTVLHAVQAVLILALSSDFAITITSTFPEGPPGTRRPNADSFFDLPIGPAIAVFLGLAALDHLLTATAPGVRTNATSQAASTGSGGPNTASAPP